MKTSQKSIWVVAIVGVLIYLFWINQESKLTPIETARMDQMDEQAGRLIREFRESFERSVQMRGAAKNRDSILYMDLVEREAKSKWEREKLLNDLVDQAGLQEASEALGLGDGFTQDEKLEMLATKYNLPLAQMSLLKAELEVMFKDEYREEYYDDFRDEHQDELGYE